MNLNQYYTQQHFGDVIVKHLNHLYPIVAMDLGIGEESFNSGRISAWIAVVIAVVLIAALTGWVIL